MKWKILIPFSIGIGIIIGVLNRIPAFYNTSITDIAVVLDMWIPLAILIIWKSKNAKEAMIKTFVFFLISQPLIYLTEVIIDTVFNGANFGSQFVQFFRNYYFGAGWALWTVLTIPGAFIAYRVKKGDFVSAIILSVATGYLGYSGMTWVLSSITKTFPNHILSGLLCLFFAVFLIIYLLKENKSRVIAGAITLICMVASIILFFVAKSVPIMANEDMQIPEGVQIIEAKVENENIAKIEISEYGVVAKSSSEVGETEAILTDSNGNFYRYKIVSLSDDFHTEEIK